MIQTDELMSELRQRVAKDDVMAMVMLGTARLKRVDLSCEHNDRSQSASDVSGIDLSVEHVAVLGEN
jgi:hypothetical protein